MKLTGRTRYRTNWRGKLILQVELAYTHVTDLNGSGHYDYDQVTRWRDATTLDLKVEVGS